MKNILAILSLMTLSHAVSAQTQIPNGGFENWGNAAPGNADEPTEFYSNKTGSSVAQLGPQTCFKDNTVVHSGAASVRIESKTAPVVSTVVNGNMTTGVINAPTTNKADGYIGSQKYNDTTDVRRMNFTGRPDSLVGWYQYTQGGTAEQGKIKATLHKGQFFDPEAGTTYHADATANKIGSALFVTPAANVGSWTRFSVPFNYVAGTTPSYIMINATSSNDQLTTVAGSKLWLDDIAVIYNSSSHVGYVALSQNVKVYCHHKVLYTDFLERNAEVFTMVVTDMTGRIMSKTSISGNGLNKTDLTGLNDGVYAYKLIGISSQANGKIILQ